MGEKGVKVCTMKKKKIAKTQVKLKEMKKAFEWECFRLYKALFYENLKSKLT